jgi:peptide subunit release factor 1 (eRF1)
MLQLEQLTAQLDRLAAFEPGPFPVVSLYLNLQPNERGRDSFQPFLRKELAERLRTYRENTPERDSLAKDAENLRTHLDGIDGSWNGVAMFACAGADLFETVPLAAPIDAHELFISAQPHLYPLARVIDEYPRYLAVVSDTHTARIFVFAVNALEKREQIENVKTKHHKQGGWSQARFQRHVDNFHLKHAKEVGEAVSRIMREEAIDKVVFAGDEVVTPLLREQLPKEIAAKIVDVLKLDIRSSERQVLERTLAALRGKDAETDRERVEEVIGAYRAGGLACAGVEQTRRAFESGQVEELLISAAPDAIAAAPTARAGQREQRSAAAVAADELIAQARRTAARIRFIEDPDLLAPIGGVGASLRFK